MRFYASASAFRVEHFFRGAGFSRRSCNFTDDTVLTAAVADALMTVDRPFDEKLLMGTLIYKFHEYGRLYPNAG